MNRPVITWDGENLPKELKSVPPGQYSLEALQDSDLPTAEEERGILDALRQLDAGKGLLVRGGDPRASSSTSS